MGCRASPRAASASQAVHLLTASTIPQGFQQPVHLPAALHVAKAAVLRVRVHRASLAV